MLNATLVSEARPLEVARMVYPFAVLLMLRPGQVATPAEAVWVLLPESVPPPGLASSATVTLLVAVPTRLPMESRISTWISGVIATPAVVLYGSTKKCARLGAAGAMSKSMDVADVSAGDDVATSV